MKEIEVRAAVKRKRSYHIKYFGAFCCQSFKPIIYVCNQTTDLPLKLQMPSKISTLGRCHISSGSRDRHSAGVCSTFRDSSSWYKPIKISKKKLFKTTVIAANLATDYKMATNKYAYSNQGRRKKCIFRIFKICFETINYLPGWQYHLKPFFKYLMSPLLNVWKIYKLLH